MSDEFTGTLKKQARRPRHRRSWVLIGLWLLVCAVFLAQAVYTVISTQADNQPTAKEVKADGSHLNPLDVVLIADTSGPTKFIGQDMADGFQDAISEGKISDDIRLVIRDDGGTAEKTAAIAQGSAAGFSTLALFGPTEQTGFQSVRDAATEGLIVALTPVGNSLDSPNGDWTFSLQAPTFQTGFKLGRILQKAGAGPHVAHLVNDGAQNSRFWVGVLGAYADVAYSTDDGLSAQIEYVWPFKSTSGSTDTIDPQSLASDVIILSLPAADAEAALRELRDDGYIGQIVLEGEGSLPNFPERFQGDPKEALDEGYFTNGVWTMVPFTPSIGNAESQRLIGNFRARHKADPSWAYAYGHDAGQLIVEFVTEAKQNDTFSLTNPGETQQELKKFLTNLKSRTARIYGYTGDLDFTPENERDLSPKFIVYQAGKQRPYYLQVSDRPHLKTLARIGENTILVGNETYKVTPVVYTGINMRELTNLDFDKGSFDATFDLWLRANEAVNFKNLTFMNALTEPKLIDQQDNFSPQGGHYQRFTVQGSFGFSPQPADLLLDRASVSISLRHSVLDNDQFTFVIDPDAVNLGGGVGSAMVRRNGDGAFRAESSLIDVADSAQNALGDPRAVHGQITFSVLSYHADLRRATSTLTSRLADALGQSNVRLIFMTLLAATLIATFLWIVRPGLAQLIMVTFFFSIILIFSESSLFTLTDASLFSVRVIEIIGTVYDFFFVFALARLVDLFAVGLLRRGGASIDMQPVILFILRFAVYLCGVAVFYVSVLGRDILPVLATASVLLTVVGLALRELIFDAVAGIAISADEAFGVGSWINIRARDRNITGRIMEVGWRFVRVRSRDFHVHDVPNSIIATQILSHLSFSSTRVEIAFVMSATVDTEIVLPAIAQALETALIDFDGVDHTRAPRVVIDGLEDDRMRCSIQLYYAANLGTDTLRTVVLNVVRRELERAKGMSQAMFLSPLRTM